MDESFYQTQQDENFFFGWFDTSSGLKNLGEFSSRVTQSRL